MGMVVESIRRGGWGKIGLAGATARAIALAKVLIALVTLAGCGTVTLEPFDSAEEVSPESSTVAVIIEGADLPDGLSDTIVSLRIVGRESELGDIVLDNTFTVLIEDAALLGEVLPPIALYFDLDADGECTEGADEVFLFEPTTVLIESFQQVSFTEADLSVIACADYAAAGL